VQCGYRADQSLKQKQRSLNGFALSSIEKNKLKIFKKSLNRAEKQQPSFSPAPISLDYRTLGYVTGVMDQGIQTKLFGRSNKAS
jgi:hypothetical protein